MSVTARGGRAPFQRPLALIAATTMSAGAMLPLAGGASADSHVQTLDPLCQGLTGSTGFGDIAFLSQNYEDAINCMARYEITQGRTPTQYAPNLDVKRYEMALFISRAIDYVESASAVDVVGAAEAGSAGFDDLDGVPSAGVQAINRLAELGIVQGKNAEEYDPFAPINRRDMARFINRLQSEVIGDPYTAEGAAGFPDVPVGMAGASDILNLQAAGIVQGAQSGNYETFRSVRRADMALFIMRHLADNVQGGNLDTRAEVPTNESLEFGPDEDATIELGGDADTRDFAATGLPAGTYEVLLVDAAHVEVFAGAVFTFHADGAGVVPASPVATADVSNGGVPVDGALSVTIQGVEPGAVVPVLYEVTGTDGGFTVGEDGLPVGDFGVAGVTHFVHPEATAGVFADIRVSDVDKVDDWFDSGTAYYFYDADDAFEIAGDPVSMSQFEAALSSGDTVSGTYRRDPDSLSTFNLVDLDPVAPAVAAEASTQAGSENDVTVTVTPVGDDWDGVVIERAPVTDGTVGPYATIATLSPADDEDAQAAGLQYVDADLAVGTYRYRAATVNDGDQGPFSTTAVTATAAAPTTPDTTAPTALDVRVTETGGSSLLLDFGDIVAVAFGEPLRPLVGGETIRATDADGTLAALVNGSGETYFTINDAPETIGDATYPPGQVLFVIVGDSQTLKPGDLAGLDFPTVITEQGGIADEAGNSWDLAGSTDLEIEQPG